MKLKDTFITYDSEDGQIMVDVSNSFAGLVRSNQIAAWIIRCLKTDITKETLIGMLGEKYDAPEEVIRHDLEEILAKLRKIGALDE